MPQCQMVHQPKSPQCREMCRAKPMKDPSMELKLGVYSTQKSRHAIHIFSPVRSAKIRHSGRAFFERASISVSAGLMSLSFSTALDCERVLNPLCQRGARADLL